MIQLTAPFKVEAMQWADVPAVMAIEHTAFTLPWSDYTYRHEILENRNSHYFVVKHDGASRAASWLDRLLRRSANGTIVAYGGFWLVLDEAHISTIASHAQWRGRGLGELMLLAMIERAAELGATTVTLEVRVSNTVAKNLYLKYGFEIVGCRPRYYRDNDEDADLMTVDNITAAAYQQKLAGLRAALAERLQQAAHPARA